MFWDTKCLLVRYSDLMLPLQGIKHSGKARRGDGNDLTPNPRKLAAIGKELDQV